MSLDAAGEEPRLGDPVARAQDAIIDDRKLRDFALDPDQPRPDGGPKARLFATVLHIQRGDWRRLRDELRRALPEGRIDRIKAGPYPTRYGITLVIRASTIAKLGVTTAWQLHDGAPPLYTVYIDVASLGA